MRKLTFILLLAVSAVPAFAQKKSKPAVKPDSAFYLRIGSEQELNQLIGCANSGFQSWVMTTSTPANQIEIAGQYFTRTLQQYSLNYQSWKKKRADSIAAIKAEQDSITKSKIKK